MEFNLGVLRFSVIFGESRSPSSYLSLRIVAKFVERLCSTNHYLFFIDNSLESRILFKDCIDCLGVD